MNTPYPFNLLVILGPTTSGKTRLAVALAKQVNGEIISADSRQVFRGMDIGTGKDLHEYGDTPYHLIDILDAGAEFSVYRFQHLFLEVFERIRNRGGMPILCGGTGLYLDAVLRGYRLVPVPEDRELRSELENLSLDQLTRILQDLKPDQHNSTDLRDRQRTLRAIEIAVHERDHPDNMPFPDISPLVIGIRWERGELRRRITTRLHQRLDEGMIEEVACLNRMGISWERLDYYGLEYRFIGAYLRGELSRDDLFLKLNRAIHDFAKRQETWFRRMERQGVTICWVEGAGDPVEAAGRLIHSARWAGL